MGRRDGKPRSKKPDDRHEDEGKESKARGGGYASWWNERLSPAGSGGAPEEPKQRRLWP